MISTFEKMQEGDEASAILMKMVAPMMPVYLMQLKAKLEIDIDEDDVAALMDLPQAEMAKANVHQFLSGMSAWGTLDDMELIQMAENDVNEYVLPVWHGIEGHEEFESTEQAVDKFFEVVTGLMKQDFTEDGEGPNEVEKVLGHEGCGRRVESRLFPHVMSLVMGDQIEVEVGSRPFTGVEKYDKFLLRGTGLGSLFKAWMVVSNN